MSAAAIEAFYEEVNVGGSIRLSSTLLYGITVGQNRRTYRDPVAVGDEDSILSQEDPPLGVKKQVSFIRDIAVQVN